MRQLTTFILLCVLEIFCIVPLFAGPFGIDMGMSLAQVKAVCKTTPKQIQGDAYEIMPPKTNDMFVTYYVRIDPDYGVYWLKAIGKDLYTNGYGDRVKSEFENLVASIRSTYGEETYKVDSLKEGSSWGEPKNFMYALQIGDRELITAWAKTDMTDILINTQAFSEALSTLQKMLDDPNQKERASNILSDSITLQNFINERKAQLRKLPSDILAIVVNACASSSTKGFVMLEYNFSNSDAVEAKSKSVF